MKSCLIISLFVGLGYSCDIHQIHAGNLDGSGWCALDTPFDDTCSGSGLPECCDLSPYWEDTINVLDIVLLANCILAANCADLYSAGGT